MNVPETETPSIFKILEANNQYCATCLEMGRCVIIEGLMNLEKWNDDNPAFEVADDEEVEISAEQQTAVEIRPRVGELFKELVGIQSSCVSNVRAGGESLQAGAVSAISESGVAGIAQKDRRA